MEIESAAIRVWQDEDTSSPRDYKTHPAQHLEMEFNGDYFTIKTDRWAFDNLEELTNQLNKVFNALSKMV